MAEQGIGLDAGHDRATASTSQAIKDTYAVQHGSQLRDDVHGLDVFPEQPPVRWFGAEGYGTVKHVIENYEGRLQAFYREQVTLTAKQQLALDLYNLSHFENASKPRFLLLVTVVEVLASPAARSAAAQEVLDALLAIVQTSALDVEEKERLSDGIGNLKKDSISGACRNFVARWASGEDSAFFAGCYRARSELLHTGQTSRVEVGDPAKLDRLVSRLLIDSLTPER